MTINCIILEDTIADRKLLAHFLEKITGFNLVGMFKNPTEAYQILATQKIDLIFSDVRMPELSGIDFFKTLVNPPMFVFISSFGEYAVDSYEVNALDFILKPVNFERFLKCIAKVQNYFQLKESPQSLSTLSTDSTSGSNSDYFVVKCDNQFVKIKHADTLYLEAFGDFVKIHTFNDTYTVWIKLKDFEEQTLLDDFQRIHRSFMVNINHIEKITNDMELQIGKHLLPISDSYKEKILSRFLDGKWVKRR